MPRTPIQAAHSVALLLAIAVLAREFDCAARAPRTAASSLVPLEDSRTNPFTPTLESRSLATGCDREASDVRLARVMEQGRVSGWPS